VIWEQIRRVCSSERQRGELRVQIELVPSSVAEEIEAEIDIKVASILDSRCANHVNLCFIESQLSLQKSTLITTPKSIYLNKDAMNLYMILSS